MKFDISAYEIFEMILHKTQNDPIATVHTVWDVIEEMENSKYIHGELMSIFIQIYSDEKTPMSINEYRNVIVFMESNKVDYINNLKDILVEYCEEEGICEKCGYRLQFSEYNEYQGEYWGMDCFEEITETFCPKGCL